MDKTDTQTDAMRDAIAEIIEATYDMPRGTDLNVGQISDAIIAALPDMLRADPSILRGMVKPLKWDKHPDEPEYYGGDQDDVTGVTPYYISIGATKGRFFVDYRSHKIRDNNDDVIWHPTLEAAQAAADAHNAATTLAGMGVVV